ncbi:MAG: hypothetical protein ABI481_13030 [Pyrinomonadaceae bacterium]
MLRKFAVLFAVTVAIVVIGSVLERRTESAPNMSEKVLGAGTPGKISKWIAADTIGDSGIAEDVTGMVGIGTNPNPLAKLFVFGNFEQPTSAIRGTSTGTGRGVTGFSEGGIGINGGGKIGVNGVSTSTDPNDAGVRGIASAAGWAGEFLGNVNITGTLVKGAGSFRIDHPLDPEHKYLSHSFVESPDMMNIYNGMITTDSSGNATVILPNYFEALNRDFRYQLTVVGQFAQAIVLEKIRTNSFKIRTDKPSTEVSWQVTGVRKDKFAEEHRIQVESDKPGSIR